MQQAFHHFNGAEDMRDPGGSSRLIFELRALDSVLGVWKDTSVRHEVIHPDLVGNREFLAEIVES
jgi:hypothetical protein